MEDDQIDNNSEASSSEDEDWEHSVATSAIDPSDESSEDNNEDVDDEVYFYGLEDLPIIMFVFCVG